MRSPGGTSSDSTACRVASSDSTTEDGTTDQGTTDAGPGKLLLPWRGRPLIDHLLAAWQASRVDRIIVVARSDDHPLLAHLQERAADPDRAVDLVVPRVAPPEMKDSVAAALAYIRGHYHPGPQDLWLLAPADLPQLNPRVIDQVLDAAMSAAGAIVVPQAGPRRGHPVAFPWSLHEPVARLGPDQGVNALLRGSHPVRPVEVVEPAGWLDIDRPEDYRRLQSLDDNLRA